MKTFVSQTDGELGKFECVVRSFADAFQGSVLDVGSRTGNLALVIGTTRRYTSLDMAPPADIIANLECGLPLADRSFDTVVALDVLEHTDAIHAAFRELLRVAARNVVIALPNAFELKARLRVLRGRHVSGKYGLPPQPRADRHRWFFGFDEANRFCEHGAGEYGWHVREAGALIGQRRQLIAPLVRQMPQLLGPTYLAWLERSPERVQASRSDTTFSTRATLD